MNEEKKRAALIAAIGAAVIETESPGTNPYPFSGEWSHPHLDHLVRILSTTDALAVLWNLVKEEQ